MMTLQPLTAERCAAIATSLQQSVSHFGLSLKPSSPLANIIRHLEWMGSFSAGPMMAGGAGESDRHRVITVVPQVEQAERIAKALEEIRGVKGADTVVSCLQDNIDRLTTLHERAQDILFEIEVGGRLAAYGCPVAFAEPDLVLEFPGERLGLPCKRPRRATRIIRALRDAVHQIERNHLPGVAVVSVEPIVHPPAPSGGLSAEKPPPTSWVADTQEEVNAAADQMVLEAVQAQLPAIQRLFLKHSSLGGVLFCGVITAWLKRPSAYTYRWISFPVASPYDEGTPSVTYLLSDIVRGNKPW